MIRSLASLALAALLAAAPAHAQTPASQVTGNWAFEAPKGLPGFTLLKLTVRDGKLQGTLTSQWYGEQPMRDVRVEGDRILFRFDNGNPRVEQHDIVLQRDGKALRLKGDIWFAHLDLTAHPATAREVAALTFRPVAVPAVLHDVPDNHLARTPPMGWSSWNKFAEAIDDRTVRQIADAMVSSGLRDAGYVYVNIDDGWQGARDTHGVLQPNAKFPDMKALADYVHSKGLKLGIYSSPGLKSCAGFPGSYGHIRQDARTWTRWGIDYVKYDLCSGEAFYHTPHDVQAVYQQMGEALQATGRPIVYSLCEYGRFDVGSWGRKAGGNLWRTTRDISDTYDSMATIGFGNNADPRHAAPGGWNDLDMLEVGNRGMSDDEYRTHLTLWAMRAAPLLTGNDLRAMTPATIALLTNRGVIAVDQDRLGQAGRKLSGDDKAEVWTRKLADGAVAVAMFNRTAAPAEMTVKWSDVGVPAGAKARDLWAGHDLVPTGDGYSATVPPHGVAMLRVGG